MHDPLVAHYIRAGRITWAQRLAAAQVASRAQARALRAPFVCACVAARWADAARLATLIAAHYRSAGEAQLATHYSVKAEALRRRT